MKANELRIGNWVEYDNRYITVEGFADGQINVEANMSYGDYPCSVLDGIRVKDLSPIPLTPEILEKAGFVKSEGYEDNIRVLRKGDRDVIGYGASRGPGNRDADDYFYVCGHYDDPFYGYPVDIEYLHQLQNLYWCLVGEELTIKL